MLKAILYIPIVLHSKHYRFYSDFKRHIFLEVEVTDSLRSLRSREWSIGDRVQVSVVEIAELSCRQIWFLRCNMPWTQKTCGCSEHGLLCAARRVAAKQGRFVSSRQNWRMCLRKYWSFCRFQRAENVCSTYLQYARSMIKITNVMYFIPWRILWCSSSFFVSNHFTFAL